MEDLSYGKFNFCLTCRKTLEDEFMASHKALGHTAEVYITMPKKVVNIMGPIDGKSELVELNEIVEICDDAIEE